MFGQLIPPPEFAPPSVKHLTSAQKVMLWGQMVDEGDLLFVAGVRAKTESDAAALLKAREILERRNSDHDRALESMIVSMRRRERTHAG
jgi:hypothetical protein